jgi:RNA polymerase sigma factor (sigma-70 family)
MFTITQEILKRFLPKDNRYIIYVLKRNRRNVYNDSQIEEIRFHTLDNLFKALQRGKQFDCEAHFVNYLSTVIDSAYKRMLQTQNALKNNLPVDNFTDLVPDSLPEGIGTDEYIHFIGGQSSYTPEYDNTNELIVETAYKLCVDKRSGQPSELKRAYFEEIYIKGREMKEVADEYGVSHQSVQQKMKNLIEDIRKALNVVA